MNIQDCHKYEKFVLDIYRCTTHWNYRQTFRHISLLTDRKGSVISFGVNGYKTHPLTKQLGYRNESIHSELDAYLKVRHYDIKFNLINFRINKQELFRNSKPCDCCLSWLLTSDRVLDIFYTTEKGFEKWNYD